MKNVRVFMQVFTCVFLAFQTVARANEADVLASGKLKIELSHDSSTGDVEKDIGAVATYTLIGAPLGIVLLYLGDHSNGFDKLVELNVDARAVSYGDDRFKITLMSEAKKGCNPFVVHLLALKNQTGDYKLQLDNSDQDVPTDVGNFAITDQHVELDFTQKIGFISSAKYTCHWTLGAGDAIVLNRSR